MEKIAFDLVKPKKGVLFNISNSEKIHYTGFAGLILISGFITLYDKIYEVNLLHYWTFKLIVFAFLLCILIGTFKAFGDSDGNNMDVNGLLFFDENEITIDYTEVYPLTEIAYIKFRGYDVKGASVHKFSDGSPKKSLGADNFLEFRYKQKKYNYQFIVESEGQRKLFQEKVIPQLRAKTKVTYSTY